MSNHSVFSGHTRWCSPGFIYPMGRVNTKEVLPKKSDVFSKWFFERPQMPRSPRAVLKKIPPKEFEWKV